MKNLKLVKFIQTKYIGPTNTRGSRVKAFDAAENSITLPWESELGIDENHFAAAQALLDKLNKQNKYGSHKITAYGATQNNGFCVVCEYKSK